MRRIRPWVKKALLVSVIVVAVGAGLSAIAGEHGRDMKQVVRVSQEVHSRPAGDMKVEIQGGEGTAIPVPPQAPMLREGGIRMERGHEHEHDIGPGAAVGGAILIAGLLLFWISRRSKRSRVADGANVLAGIPSASDFLDQWEMQQNQTKESK